MEQQKPKNEFVKKGSRVVNSSITVKAITAFIITKWYWFVISLFVSFVVAFVYLNRITPLYTRTASLLIKNEEKTAGSGTSIDMTELGLTQNNVNLQKRTAHIEVSRLDEGGRRASRS